MLNPQLICNDFSQSQLGTPSLATSPGLSNYHDPLSIYYPLSSNQRLAILISSNTQIAYLETLTETTVAHQTEVYLSSPFDLRLLLQRVPHPHMSVFFHNNFTIRLSKGVYTLFPLLRGGGGALTTCVGPTTKKSQTTPSSLKNDENQSLQDEIEKKMQDIKEDYLPERDQYHAAGEVGSFYEELVKKIFDKIQSEDKGILKLSTKSFRKYVSSEIQNEEAKMLRARFGESLKNKDNSLGDLLQSLINLVRKELYQGSPSDNRSEDVIAEPLQPYEEKIMVRMITSVLLRSVNPYVSEPDGFESKVATKLLKYAKHMMKIKNDEKSPTVKINSTFKPKFNRDLLSLTCEEAIKKVQIYVLRGLAWNKYSASLLVKHYNAIRDSTETIDERNKKIIEKIVSNMLSSYQDREDSLTPGEINELVGLGGIKHQTKSPEERTLFQRLLSQLSSDINNDLMFDSLKTQALATIIFQHSTDESEASKIHDDLKQCMDVLHRQVERRLFTVENQNMQGSMDAMNLVLYTMENVKGLRANKEMAQLVATFKDQLPSLAKKASNLIFGNKSDPSLTIKAKYGEEALKRIDPEDHTLSNLEAAILQAAPTIVGIVGGVFSFDVSSVIDGFKDLIIQGVDHYASLGKSWYDEVNKVFFLANMEFEKFEERYFSTSKKRLTVTGEELTYFVSRELYNIARTTHRRYTERKKMIEWLGDIYQGKNIKGERLNHFNFIGKQDIKVYLHKCLSDLARMPLEENLSFAGGLAEVAQGVLERLKLEPIKHDTLFEFISHNRSHTNTLLLHALKSSMTLEYAFSVMFTNCTAYYEKEIKPLDYIEIEGEKYINRSRADKREPLWSSSTNHALDTFLKSPQYPVLLIQGDAGTGKSTFLKIIEYQQWKDYKQGVSDYIPIFIRLSEIVNPAKCLTELFQTLHFSHKVLEQLKEEGSTRKYLFIFDGYDELKAPKNLYKVNKLSEYGENVKMIITSREEYLKGYGDYIKYFRPKGGNDLLEYRITPLSERQQETYLARRALLNRKAALLNRKAYEQTNDEDLQRQLQAWISVDKYVNTIKSIPSLKDLIKTPYMLTIITHVLPSLESGSKVTRANIYKVFTMKGFETEMNRILENSKEDFPKGLDLEKSFYEFAKDLAINLFLTDRTSVKTDGSNYIMDYVKTQPYTQEGAQEETNTNEAQRFARFFSEDPKVKLARSGVPITMMDGQVRFNHKSIMEYFAARCLYDDLKFCPVDTLHKRSLNWKLLNGGGQTNQESDVLNFLKEMIADNDSKQATLNPEENGMAKPLGKSEQVPSNSSPLRKNQSSPQLRVSPIMTRSLKGGSPENKGFKRQEGSKIHLQEVETPDDQGLTTEKGKKSETESQHFERWEQSKLHLQWIESSNEQDLNPGKEDKSGVHVTNRLKEAIEIRDKNDITDIFYINVLMVLPELIGPLDEEELKKLEQLPNTSKQFKRLIADTLAKWYFSSSQKDLYTVYAFQCLNYKLGGKFQGATSKDSKEEWILYADGQGEISYENEDTYKGSWVKDVKDGYGMYTFANNDKAKIYNGYWENDYFHGQGRMEFKDGVYYGQWSQGFQDGWGEYIQYGANKEVVELYRGHWSQGQKHGTGTVCFIDRNYHGEWEHGILVSGQMEFANGVKAIGTLSQEQQGFRPDTKKVKFNHEFYVKAANTDAVVYEKILRIERKLQGKEDDIRAFGKDFLAQDSDDGNSAVLLYCRNAGSRDLNEMMPHFLKILVSEPPHTNKRGENLIHMLISNKNISIQYKNNLLDKLKELQPEFYLNNILPAGRKDSVEPPLLYAIKYLRMRKIQRKNVDFIRLRLSLIKKLTPLESARKYILEQIKRAGINFDTLILQEFDSNTNDDLYLGPVSARAISNDIQKLSNDVLALLIMRGETETKTETEKEKELLLNLIKDQFFFLSPKSLMFILLSNLKFKTRYGSLEDIFIQYYSQVSFLDIKESLIDQLPASIINNILKADKKIILEKYSNFLNILIRDCFCKYDSYSQLKYRPLFKNLLEIALREIAAWKQLCSWLRSRFKDAFVYDTVTDLLDDYKRLCSQEDIAHLVIWLATAGETGIFRSPKYYSLIFIHYYNDFKKLGGHLETYYTYQWFENYLQFSRSKVKRNPPAFKPEDFHLEKLVDFMENKLDVFKPLISQSLVVFAIEMKYTELALELVKKCEKWIQKLHYWEVIWIHNGMFYKTPDSTSPVFDENTYAQDHYVVVRNRETTQAGQNIINEFTELDTKYQYRFYNNQFYFANPNIHNLMVVSETPTPETPITKITEGVAIVEGCIYAIQCQNRYKEEAKYHKYYDPVSFVQMESASKMLKSVTHKSMQEVFQMLMNKSVDIVGLTEYLNPLPDYSARYDRYKNLNRFSKNLALDLLLRNGFLLYDKDYVYKYVTFQMASYKEGNNYRELVHKYMIEQYTKAFENKLSRSDVSAQPEMVKIAELFLRSPSHNGSFFRSFINCLMESLWWNRKGYNQNDISFLHNNISLLHEVINFIQDYLLPEDYAQLCWNAYINIKSPERHREDYQYFYDLIDTRRFYYKYIESKRLLQKFVHLKLQVLNKELQSQQISEEKMNEKDKEETEFYKDKQQEYRKKYLSDEIAYLEDLVSEEKDGGENQNENENVNELLESLSEFTNKSSLLEDFGIEPLMYFDARFKFFVDLVWKNLPNLSSRKATKVLFQWVDNLLLDKHTHKIKLLINTVLSGKLNFEDVTPFAMLIYERLLALTIEKNLKELAFGLLEKFKGKLQRVKAWEVVWDHLSGDNDEKEPLEANKAAINNKVDSDEDNKKDLKFRDKRLQYFTYNTKMATLVPAAIDIEHKTPITRETEDIVMIVEEENDYILHKLTLDNMKDVFTKIKELGIDAGNFESIFNKDIVLYPRQTQLKSNKNEEDQEDPENPENPKKIDSSKQIIIHKDFGFLCRLSVLNYPLSEKAQARLKSPSEWSCRNYKDYLWLLENYPDSHDDPIRWLLDPKNKTNVLKKIMLSLNSEEKAKYFFNDFVSRYTKEPIKFAEEVLLAQVIEKHRGIIFTAYLKLINANPEMQNRFSYVYRECILKNLDATTAQDLLLHLTEFPESCPNLDQLVTETLVEAEGLADLFYYQLIKQLLNSYLSGRKTLEQVGRWMRLFFTNSELFVGVQCSDQELTEILICNLFKSLIGIPDADLDQVSCLFSSVITCLGYSITMSENNSIELARIDSPQLLTWFELSLLYQELIKILQVNTLKLPGASTCKGYAEFLKNTGIVLPSDLDLISFLLLSIQVALNIQLIIELGVDPMDYSTTLQFVQSNSEIIMPIQYSMKDNKNSILISYYIESSPDLPSLFLFKTNTDNLYQVKSALSPKSMQQPYNPFLVSIRCLHDSLQVDTDENIRISLKQAFPYFTLFSHQDSSSVTLCEQLVYNCLYCLCSQASLSNQPAEKEALEEAFKKAKEGVASILNVALAILGIESQISSEGTITINKIKKPLCSPKDLLRLRTYLTELVVITTETNSKMFNRSANECIGYQDINKLYPKIPQDMTALNFCLLSIAMACEIQSASKGQDSLKLKFSRAENFLPQMNYLLNSSEADVVLYCKISPVKEPHTAYFINMIPFSAPETQQLLISRGKPSNHTSEYITFSRAFLLNYWGPGEWRDFGELRYISSQDLPRLLKKITYNHKYLACARPEQLNKIRLLEHIMGIFFKLFDLTQRTYFSDNLTVYTAKKYFLREKDIPPLSFLKLIILALGYNLEIEESSRRMSLTQIAKPICHMRELLGVRAFFIDTKRVSKRKSSRATDCTGYELFKNTTGFSIPKQCDEFSLYIFLIDLAQSMFLVEDLAHQNYRLAEKCPKVINKIQFVLESEGQLKPMSLVEEEGVTIVNINYRIRITKEWPDGHIFEINESNYDEIRRLLNSEKKEIIDKKEEQNKEQNEEEKEEKNEQKILTQSKQRKMTYHLPPKILLPNNKK